MNDMDNDIQEFVISFFKTISSDIVQSNNIYKISIPEKYKNYFQKQNIKFTFDKETALNNDCELVIPGSIILSTIIKLCSSRGSISLKMTKTDNGQTILRYHFFVNFAGIHNISKLTHVDVNLDTSEITHITNTMHDADFLLDECITSEKITPSYIAALDSLKEECQDMQTKFLSDANQDFQKDLDTFTTKYDAQIRHMDDKINKKDMVSIDDEKTRNFRFENIEKIKIIEGEKTRLIDALEKKHKITLEYSLVACEVILT